MRIVFSSARTTWRRADQATQLRVYHLWDPIWALLTPQASLAIRKGNYERLFDAARRQRCAPGKRRTLGVAKK